MKIRKSFISNSSSCSFICDLSPKNADTKIKKIITFINNIRKTDATFSDLFNPSFKASKTFAEKYDRHCLVKGYHSVDTVENMTIIYPKIEDNKLRNIMNCAFDHILTDLLDGEYVRHDDHNLEEFLT